MKTETVKKIILTKIVEWLEYIEKYQFYLLIIKMIEAMYAQSPEYFTNFWKNLRFVFLNIENDLSYFFSNINFAFVVQSN